MNRRRCLTTASKGGRGQPESNLFERLNEGKRRLPARHDTDLLREAADLALSVARSVSDGTEYDDSQPFGRRSRVQRYLRWRATRMPMR